MEFMKVIRNDTFIDRLSDLYGTQLLPVRNSPSEGMVYSRVRRPFRRDSKTYSQAYHASACCILFYTLRLLQQLCLYSIE